jgi:hypothetical protein
MNEVTKEVVGGEIPAYYFPPKVRVHVNLFEVKKEVAGGERTDQATQGDGVMIFSSRLADEILHAMRAQ